MGRHTARMRTLSTMHTERVARTTALGNFGTVQAVEAYGRLTRAYGSRQYANGGK